MSGYISKLAYSYNLPYNCQLYCEIPGVTEARYTHFLGENSWQVKILSESDLNMMFTNLRDPSRNTSSVQFKVICDP